jgi:hypothetical protein
MHTTRRFILRRGLALAAPVGLLIVMLMLGLSERDSRAAPLDCPPPPIPYTPEPLWVDPVQSPTTLLTQIVSITLGRGRAITLNSEAGTTDITGTFDAYSPTALTAPLAPRITHHLSVSGLVEYQAGCFYTLNTSTDRNGHPLTIVQVTPTVYLPLIVHAVGVPVIAGCGVFPPDNPWNQDISGAPVDPNSANYIASINQGATKLHPDFGSYSGYGIPYTVVTGLQPMVPITYYSPPQGWPDESDPGPYPVPPNAPIEGGAGSTGDRHVLVLNSGNCKIYELYRAFKDAGGSGWFASSGAIFDLNSNALRPEGWTSADAAGLPILPGLVRYDEVASGAIKHAVRFTVWRSQKAYIHPATHYASSYTDPNLPPMGLRLRLKAGYDISGFTGQSRVILEALKRYGMLVADNGSSWYISGATDPRWDDDDLNQIKTVPGSAFEVVYTGPLIKP